MNFLTGYLYMANSSFIFFCRFDFSAKLAMAFSFLKTHFKNLKNENEEKKNYEILN